MTEPKQPEALQLADEFDWWRARGITIEPRLYDAATELRRLHAENEALRAGYAAARLEIESLQARIKTMAEERADELMVAHLDGRMRAAQPAGAQQPDTAYAELPSYEHQRAIMEAERNASLDEYSRIVPLTSTESMIYERAFTNGWNRHASHGQAPAQAAPAYKDSTPELHVGDSAFENWYSTYSPAHKGDKQRARDAYAAGMGDPLVTAAPANPAPQQEAQEPGAGARCKIIQNCKSCQHSVGRLSCALAGKKFNGLARAPVPPEWCPLPLYTPQTSPASQGDALDAARLDWLLLRISGAEFRRIGVHYSGNARRADVDTARKQGANHD